MKRAFAIDLEEVKQLNLLTAAQNPIKGFGKDIGKLAHLIWLIKIPMSSTSINVHSSVLSFT